MDFRRHITPPTNIERHAQPNSAGPQSASSACTRSSFASHNASPSSILTHYTTPPRSPATSHGPPLLPKIRQQDQRAGQVADTARARRESSVTSTGFPRVSPSAILEAPLMDYSRSVSPADLTLMTPVSESSPFDHSNAASNNFLSTSAIPASLYRPSLAHGRSVSASVLGAHARKASTQLNEASYHKYMSPSYPDMSPYAPAYTIPDGSMNAAGILQTMPTISTGIEQTAIQALPSSTLPALAPSFQQTLLQPADLQAELLFETYPEPPATTTLLEYLTAPNPSPQLVKRTPAPNRLADTHFWWDMRNLRTWDDFDLATICAIPAFTELLNSAVPEPALEPPKRGNMSPETLACLQSTHRDHYATKVNAALKVALGRNHLNIQAHGQAAHGGTANPRPPPDFTSSHANDFERTFVTGEARGRVVGIVKTFDQWNSAMSAETSASRTIEYMRGLAHLHRHMREHSCRYGFIITEIELLCVRAGTEDMPFFGLLELAPPIQLSTHGTKELTACLALWYLNMLAKDTPLPGQCSWKLDIGGPAALTRQNVLERDSWMKMKPEGKEKRDAKRNRGWIWPVEPLSRRECAGGRRRSAPAKAAIAR